MGRGGEEKEGREERGGRIIGEEREERRGREGREGEERRGPMTSLILP